jgi:hypothetical protein
MIRHTDREMTLMKKVFMLAGPWKQEIGHQGQSGSMGSRR